MFFQLRIWMFYSSEIVWGCQHETLNLLVIPFHSFVKLFRAPFNSYFSLGTARNLEIIVSAVLARQAASRQQWMDWSWNLLKAFWCDQTARVVEALSLMCSFGGWKCRSGELQPVGPLPVFHTVDTDREKKLAYLIVQGKFPGRAFPESMLFLYTMDKYRMLNVQQPEKKKKGKDRSVAQG